MRSALATVANRRANRQRSTSLSAVPPSRSSTDYLPELAAVAASIIYKSPLPSQSGLPIFIVNAAAFPDSFDTDFDSLLPYVLARLPGEDELLSGAEYEIIFFAGGTPEGATSEKKQGPGIGWYLQAYHVLSRATRKKLQRLYIVHPRTWVRVLVGVFGTVVSPKFRRKIVHVNTLSGLAMQVPVEKLLIPPAVYLHDRKLSPEIDVPYASGRRAFGAKYPLPRSLETGKTRLPRVLREATSFVIMPPNVKTEGLFRIPPHSVLTAALKEAYDRGQKFIIWKERGATYVQPGMDQALLDEVRLEDAYGIHSAASLIKTWYRDLREPIFPESCYAELRHRYSNPDVQVTPEDLVDILLPASDQSPLSDLSREILTRHLLPMLSAVASHEASNKMSPENLGICFAMALVCGSNQIEDAKMTSVIRRVLQAAIEMWPQLRQGLGLTEQSFLDDISPPADSRDYEDPLEEQRQAARHSEDDAVENHDPAHRIVMSDLDSPVSPVQRAPTLPPRPPPTSRDPFQTHPPPVPRRKPAPPSPAIEQPTFIVDDTYHPPRYSTIFDADPPIAESPAASYASQNLVHSSLTSESPSYSTSATTAPSLEEMSAAENVKKGFLPAVEPPKAYHPALNMPRRRPLGANSEPTSAVEGPPAHVFPSSDGVSRAPSMAEPTSAVSEPARTLPDNGVADSTLSRNTNQKEPTSAVSAPASAAPPPLPTRSASTNTTTSTPQTQNAFLARSAAQRAAATLAQRSTVDEPVSAPGALQQNTISAALSNGGFRKPSWPASTTRLQQHAKVEVPTLAKPVLPSRNRSQETRPISMMPASGNEGLKPGTAFGTKARAPSPGLLRRMSSIEVNSGSLDAGDIDGAGGASNSGLGPRKLNLKKASVDDLRRLYEERGKVVEGLGRVESVRRTNS